MKIASYPRLYFGAWSIVWGAMILAWHLVKFPVFVNVVLGVAIIAGGVLIALTRTVRWGSLALAAAYLVVALAEMPAVVAAPLDFTSYIGFFEILSLVVGALAPFGKPRAASIWYGICTITFGWAQVVPAYIKYTASLVPAWLPPNGMFWTWATTILFWLAALAMIINIRARLALQLTALMVALFGILVWIPMLVAHPEKHFYWSEFALTFLISGAAWLVAERNSL